MEPVADGPDIMLRGVSKEKKKKGQKVEISARVWDDCQLIELWLRRGMREGRGGIYAERCLSLSWVHRYAQLPVQPNGGDTTCVSPRMRTAINLTAELFLHLRGNGQRQY